MRKLIFLFFLLTSCNKSKEYFENSYCIENINIIDSVNGLKKNMTIVISGNKILKVGKTKNLSLSKKPYHESYPSIIETLGDQKDIILWSNSVHDFFYNFYLTKSLLINDSRVESNLLDIVIKTPAMINELFLESFKQSI